MGVGGLEPPTSALSEPHSNQLSYTPVFSESRIVAVFSPHVQSASRLNSKFCPQSAFRLCLSSPELKCWAFRLWFDTLLRLLFDVVSVSCRKRMTVFSFSL